MDKNTITGVVLLMLMWLGFSYYMQTEATKQEAIQKKAKALAAQKDSIRKSATLLQDTTNIVKDTSIVKAALIPEQTFRIENEDCKYIFSNKGGQLKSIELKKYTTYDKKPLILFDNKTEGLSVELPLINNKINSDQIVFDLNEDIDKENNKVITYTTLLANGGKYSHRYIIPKSGYDIDFLILTENAGKDLLPLKTMPITWSQRMLSLESNIYEEQIYSTLYYANDKKEVDELSSSKDENIKTEEPLQWVSFKQKFFNSALISTTPFENNATLSIKADKNKKTYVKDASASLEIPVTNIANAVIPFQFYFGPNQYNTLKKLDVGLQEVIPLGWGIFGWVNKFLIIPVFNFLHKFIANYGIIILILTLLIKLILTPLTQKQLLSTVKMQVLKPEIDELKKKYGDDKQTFGVKQMELFRESGVNPAGGCLPMLLQMPILMAMYRFFPSSIELRQQPFLWAKDLSHYDDFIKLPFDIPLVGNFIGNHISIFALLMAITSVIYSKMSTQGQEQDGIMGQQMKIMMYVMPFMMFFMFNKFSSALSYYYLLFNVFSIAQTYIYKNFIIDQEKIHADIKLNKTKPKKKGAFQSKLEEMMKAQEEQKKLQNKK
jgi:YidC/Oxa1 family membrane protein insertase